MSDSRRNAGAALVGRIEALRHERGLTVAELAARAEVDRALLESLGDEVPDLGISVFARLAAALGVEPDDLLEGIEWIPDGRGGGEYRVGGSGRGRDD
jgi:transcriptional regulator with XRE-family HTH domain